MESLYQDWDTKTKVERYNDSLTSPTSRRTAPVTTKSSPPPIDLDLLRESWFDAKISREDATANLLQYGDIGSFVVRLSSTSNCFAISFVTEKREVKHQLIYYCTSKDGATGFSFKESPTADSLFSSVQSLLQNCTTLIRLQAMSKEKHEPVHTIYSSALADVPNTRDQQSNQLQLDEQLALRLAQEEFATFSVRDRFTTTGQQPLRNSSEHVSRERKEILGEGYREQ